MSHRQLLPCVVGFAVLFAVSCTSSDESRPGGLDIFSWDSGPASSGGSAGAGGSAGPSAGSSGSPDAGDDAGISGESGAAHAGKGGSAGGELSVCGDEAVGTKEDCDGANLDGETCETLGFDSGTLSCLNCSFDVSGCSGVECCYDGVDNDADSDVDCSDSDCAAFCSDPCASPIALGADPVSINGNSSFQPDMLQSSCIPGGSAGGADLLFSFIPANTGVADLVLASVSANFTLSARMACPSAASELACANLAVGPGAVERLRIPVDQGVPVHILVDGASPSEQGGFVLDVESRPIACGDAHRDGPEQCDDGNDLPNDGCSETCTLESTETEPNGTTGQADPFSEPFTGSVDPAGDADVIKVIAAHPASNIVVDTFDLGDGACSLEQMDTYVRIIASDGATVLAEDDDSGSGYCAHANVGGVPAGDYFVQLQASNAAQPTFPYRLAIQVGWCGDGVLQETEECDDGNTASGDGCGPTCRIQ